MNIAIDFHLYKSSNNFAVKEYVVFELDPLNRKISLLEHNIVLPFTKELNSSEEYTEENKLFNIPWETGNIEQEQMVVNVNTYLKICSRIFVRDETIKTFILSLLDINSSLTKIISLSDFGYIEIFPKGNTCDYHDTEQSNCAIVNAKNMLNWYIEYFSILLI